jgi:hypothetical protein
VQQPKQQRIQSLSLQTDSVLQNTVIHVFRVWFQFPMSDPKWRKSHLVLIALIVITSFTLVRDTSFVQDNISSSSVVVQSTNHVSPFPFPCVIVPYPSGWGNAFLIFLLSVLKNARYDTGNVNDKDSTPRMHEPPVFPCVRGYGEVFGKLFLNVHSCPLDDDDDDDNPIDTDHCYTQAKHFPIVAGQWYRIKEFVWEELPKFPSLLQLNVTFVEEVFASSASLFTLNELRNSSCAVHVRFGDAYFRDKAIWKGRIRPDSRVKAFCNDDGNTTTVPSSCFAEAAKKVREKCPDPRVPIYLATDLPQFNQYFCSEENNRTNNRRFLSSCEEKNMTHIIDAHLTNKNNFTVNDGAMVALYSMLSEWLALAFAKELSGLTRSTFSQTAAFEYSAI